MPGECLLQGIKIVQDVEFAYKKQITIPVEYTGKLIRIRFDAVYSYARVWINGKFVRDHYGSFTTWYADITKYVKPGESALPGQPASEVNVLVEDLISAHKRGLKVRVILDQTEGFTDSANDAAAQYLRENGVEVLREDLATQTHAKLVVIDDDKVVVGSTNWTQPALEDGNEASVLITSREVNKVYQDYVHALLQNAAPYQTVKRDIWAPTTAPNQRK